MSQGKTRPILERLKSRKFLLALFGQLTGLAVLIFPEHESEIEAAASHAGALVLMALTAAGWIAGESYVDRETVAGETTDRQREGHLAHQREQDAQRRGEAHQNAKAMPALVVALVLAGGCAASPEDRWHQAQDALTTARTAILAQHGAGNISDEQLVRLDEFEKAARLALEAAEPLARGGDAANADLLWHLDLAEQVIGRLIDYLGHPDDLGNPGRESDHERSRAPETGRAGERDPDRGARHARVHASAGGAARARWPAHHRRA